MIVYEFRQLRPLIALAIHLRTIRTPLRSQVEKDWSVEIFGFSKRFLSPRIPIDQLLARVLKIRRLASFQVVGACRSGAETYAAAPVAIKAHRRGGSLPSRVRMLANETPRGLEGFNSVDLIVIPGLRISRENDKILTKSK